MKIYFYILLIFLIPTLTPIRSEALSESNCAESKQLNEQCGGHCYRIIKPLLEYASTVQAKEKELTKTINEFQSLKDKIKTMEAQQEASKAYKECCSNHEDLLASYKMMSDKLENFNTVIANKDAEITQLKSQMNTFKKETFATSCLGKLTDVHEIQVPGTRSFHVFCDSSLTDSVGWTVVQRRIDGSENFVRKWADYKMGFGTLRGEFFIGLEKLHLMTKSHPHELIVYTKDYNNNVNYARYSHFLIGGEEEGFMIKSVGDYSGNYDFKMDESLNIKFSTFDKNHDTSGNCVNQTGGWFNNCRSEGKKSLKLVQRMIRPIQN